MHLELIKVTKDLHQDKYQQFIPPTSVYSGVYRSGEKAVGFNGDLGGWIEHFKNQGVKTYLRYGVGIQMKGRKRSGKKTCALYREVLPADREDVVYLKNAAEKVLATELSSPEGYVYPRKG